MDSGPGTEVELYRADVAVQQSHPAGNRRAELIDRILRRQPGASLPHLHNYPLPIAEEANEHSPVGNQRITPGNMHERHATEVKGPGPGGKHYLEPIPGISRKTPSRNDEYMHEHPSAQDDRASAS